MKQAYLDCSSGISGDMFLAVLIDAGVPVDKLFGELKKLALGFYEFKRTRALRGGLVGTRVDIRVPGEQPHRKLADIQALIEKAALPEKAAGQALKIFSQLAEVEGKLHNVPAGEVHFHEIGAVDAVIDIVGTCVGLEMLEISELICSPLNVGSGQRQRGARNFARPRSRHRGTAEGHSGLFFGRGRRTGHAHGRGVGGCPGFRIRPPALDEGCENRLWRG